MSRQPLGQHFLADVYWREEIARAIRVSPRSEVAAAAATEKGDFCWIEIGPGHGEMTEYLVGSGAAVHVIEVDQFLIGHLNRLKKKNPNLEVICADILETDLGAVANGKRMRIYGSLPYYITSPILHHLFQFAELIDEIHVVVQGSRDNQAELDAPSLMVRTASYARRRKSFAVCGPRNKITRLCAIFRTFQEELTLSAFSTTPI